MAIRPKTTAQVLEDQRKTSKPAEPITPPKDSGLSALNDVERFAIEQAGKAEENPVLFEHLRAVNQAREVTYLKVLVTLLDLRETYGRETLATWPEPETTQKEAGNKLPDKFTIQYYDPEKRKSRPINKTYFGCWVDATAEGKAVNDKIDALEALIKGQEHDGGEAYANWSKADQSLELSRLRQERKTMIDTVRDAIKVERQCALIEEHLAGKVSYAFARKIGDNGKKTDELRPTKEPVLLWDDASSEDKEKFTVTSFLNFDVIAAAAKNGTLADLRSSKKAKKPSTKGGESNSTQLPSLERFATWANLMATQLSSDAFTGTMIRQVANETEDGADMTAALGAIYSALTLVMYDTSKLRLPTMNGVVGKKYVAMLERARKVDKSADAA